MKSDIFDINNQEIKLGDKVKVCFKSTNCKTKDRTFIKEVKWYKGAFCMFNENDTPWCSFYNFSDAYASFEIIN
jgi:hypothetical protein